MKYGIIYRAFLENGKSYIGQTIKALEERQVEHKHNSKRGISHFYNAIRKYGFDKFMWEILDEGVSKEELDQKETKWIENFDSLNNGFNSRTGGSRGLLRDDVKKRIGEKNKGENNGMFGKLAWNSGKHLSDEHKNKIKTKFKKSHIPWNKGKVLEYKHKSPCSNIRKQKISKANSGENNGQSKLTWDKVREIRKMAKNGILLKTIAQIFNISAGHVSIIVNNKQWKE